MKLFKNTSHRFQVGFMGAATAGVVLAISAIALLVLDWNAERDQLASERATTSQVIASNVAAAMVFGDDITALETLDPLAQLDGVEHVALVDSSGDVFVEIGRNMPTDLIAEDGSVFVDGELITVSAVIAEGDRVGSMIVRSNLDAFQDSMKATALVVVTLFFWV